MKKLINTGARLLLGLIWMSAGAGAVEPSLCQGSFAINFKVNDDFGLTLKKETKQNQFTVFDHGTDQLKTFNSKQCQYFASKIYPLLEKGLREAKRVERKKIACRQIASIEYQVGSGAKKNQKVCLASAKKDSTTWALKEFYDRASELGELSP